MSTVRATRAASADTLYTAALTRIEALAAEVAGRSLRDAHRHGLSVSDLIEAIEAANREAPRKRRAG